MKREFKEGDRVAVYHGTECRQTGTIERITVSGHCEIIPDTGSSRRYAHPNQCRRLVPRKRREWEIMGTHHKGYAMISSIKEKDFVCIGPELNDGERVVVREVPKKVRK